ncbi:unnamed protein product [Caenorhabditis angaria]|uniref:Domain of unknown function DX domain-containing protein n=1 Tax=Caenorhabditis angaria TaxID=860376 RepID=A0A9P1IWR9_9PELO|nr:unnamed protein product [Caenorhabditis angaria]
MKLFQIFIFINLFYLTYSQITVNYHLDDYRIGISKQNCEEHLSQYNLSFSKDRVDEYKKNFKMLTLFRYKKQTFFCETNCPFGMMAGCKYELLNGSSFECEEFNLPKNSLCSPPLPYLLHTNMNKNFENSTLTKTHIENPPYTNLSSNFSLKCRLTKDCPRDHYCSEIYHLGNDQKYQGEEGRFCMAYPTENARIFGDLKVCDKSEECYREKSTCNKNSFVMNDERRKGFCELGERCTIGVSTRKAGQICHDESDCPKGTWCDIDETVCCKEDKNILREAHYCPDGVTPFQQEPNCTFGNMDNKHICDFNIWGVKRTKPGICWAGKCCPNLKRVAQDQFEIGNFPYESNMMCDPLQPLPLKYVYKWCDSETRKIYTIGLLDYEKQRIQSSQWNCRTSSDCKGERETFA